jgi:hypothetical protein
MVHGNAGEFSIQVGEKTIIKKGWFGFPSGEKILAAVRQALAQNA